MEPEEYQRLAELEDRMWYFRALHGHCLRLLRARLGTGPCAVLDAGCGTGGLIRHLTAHVPAWSLTGLDLSPLACERAARRCRARIVQGPAAALPFPDGAFAAVVAADLLYALDDPGAALREFRRGLRPGGWVVVDVPAYRWLRSRHDAAVHGRHRFVRREVAELLRAAGFAVEYCTHWNALSFPLIVIRRKILGNFGPASDVQPQPAPVEAALRGLMALEAAWLRLGGRWAWGCSILAVGRRPA